MRNKFAITLICLTTLLYSSIFAISFNNDSKFLDEINHQIMRLQGRLHYSEQITTAKHILTTVHQNTKPPQNWLELLDKNLHQYGSKAFYFFKIYLLESNLSQKDIDSSYITYLQRADGDLSFNLRFPGTGKLIRFSIFSNNNNGFVSGLFYPINNKDFSADYNNDNIIDEKDLLLATELLQKY